METHSQQNDLYRSIGAIEQSLKNLEQAQLMANENMRLLEGRTTVTEKWQDVATGKITLGSFIVGSIGAFMTNYLLSHFFK